MKTIILLLLFLVAQAQYCSEDEVFKYESCVKASCATNQLQRLQNVYGSDGITRVDIIFHGEVTSNDNSVTVTIKYTDNKADALIKQNNANSCIEGQLFRYGLDYSNGVADPSTITSTFDEESGNRVLSFNILASEYETKLLKNSNGKETSHSGYYSYKFLVGSTTVMQYFFTFQIKQIGKQQSNSIYFIDSLEKFDATCVSPNNCISQATSSLKYCSDKTCSTPTETLQFAANKQFWILQTITSEGYDKFNLQSTIVTFKSETLQYTVTPITTTNKPGQLILGLIANFADPTMTIIVDSILASPSRRQQQFLEKEGTSVSAHAKVESDTIQCVKEPATQLCPSQDVKCRVNGFPVSRKIECLGQMDYGLDDQQTNDQPKGGESGSNLDVILGSSLGSSGTVAIAVYFFYENRKRKKNRVRGE